MNTRMILVLCIMVITTMSLVFEPAVATAEEVVKGNEPVSAIQDDGGAIVRRKLLYRSTRLELTPTLAFSVADSYTQTLLAGIGIGFHLTNEIGISGSFNYGVLQLPTSLRQAMNEALPESVQSRVSFSKINWAADLAASWVPVFGKFSIMSSLIVNYDIHLLGGVGFVSLGADPAVEGGRPSATLNQTGPSAVLGGGARFFFGDMFSINIDVRDYLLSRALVSRTGTGASAELGNNLIMSLGLSLFLPGEVKVSR